MKKQLQDFFKNLITQILGLVTKSVTAVESNVNLISTNPVKLIVITIIAFLAYDFVSGGKLELISSTLSIASQIKEAVTLPVAIVIAAIVLFRK